MAQIPSNHLAIFGHKYGFYCFPTIELANWLKDNFDLSKMIEIGAGHGALARYLKIPATDSKLMDDPQIQNYYSMMGQPTVKYPNDVEKITAKDAVYKYKPKIVLGCWVTHKYTMQEHDRGGNMYGVDEGWILKRVDQYIIIGNEKVHNKKKILDLPHKAYQFPWLYSRSVEPTKNIIYVWDKVSI
ncbi:MAG: hypothetical protein PHF86_05310 [Candidatus Nanoarchaeia archaeon]|nr:hypothetical protein [Candidatus Nanoarchaeia archaeon]